MGGNMIGKSVGSIVSEKQIQELITVPPSATVFEAVAAMSRKGVGAILIRSRGDAIDGIFTERDLMTRVVNAGRDPKTTPMSTVMSPQVRRVESSMSIEDALSLMVVHDHRHLLVEDGGTIKGIVSLRDFMATMVIPDEPIAHEGRVGVTLARAEVALRTVSSMKSGSSPPR
jgi:CBS domain-containing protein